MSFSSTPLPQPLARADCMIHDSPRSKWRITVLSQSLIRIEWSEDGVFEDNPTQKVVNRDFGFHPDFTVRQEDGQIIVETATFRLTYDKQPFSREGLSVVSKNVSGNFNMWHYGDSAEHGNLGGTARTLDEVDGATRLDPGVISADGWAIFDDSTSNEVVPQKVVDGQDNPFGTWVRPREHTEKDIYVFAYGHDYVGAIRDLYALTGQTPLLPRYALGNWWSRFYPYTDTSYKQLMTGFKKARIPFSVSVLDMDWHRTDVDPKYGIGWTGYSWNKKMFPDPKRFLHELHHMGMHVTLNVHPRDGVRAFEDDYPTIARQMGIDPASGNPVLFDIARPRFAHAYFDLHHRLEKQGVDFWWVDWQQGGVTRQKNLDPLWMLNDLHYKDSAHDGRWPLTFSRYAGIGSHRYPVGFSGDTVVSWKSLQFQPYFTATASNVGYGWWSHDIGGHMLGYHDSALETRWYWLGAFSPINRLHCSASPFMNKDPRTFPQPYQSAMIRALQVRHQLLPYLYSMNWRAHRQGRPLVEPLYWRDPDNTETYNHPSEYYFGSSMLVSAIVSPDDSSVHLGSTDMWFPHGDWFDVCDGRHYEAPGQGGRTMKVWRAMDRMPVFAPAGSIIPVQTLPEGEAVNSVANPHSLCALVFPGADCSFHLVEDDGVYNADDAKIRTAVTTLSQDWSTRTITISAVDGAADVVPADRTWTIVLRGVANPLPSGATEAQLPATVGSAEMTVSARYDEATLSLSIELGVLAANQSASIQIEGLQVASNPIRTDSMAVLYEADMPYVSKDALWREINENGVQAIASLDALDRDPQQDQSVEAIHKHGIMGSSVPASVRSALMEVLARSK